MRIAVITDIHGNLTALEAALSAIDAIGIDGISAGAIWSDMARTRMRSVHSSKTGTSRRSTATTTTRSPAT